MMCKNCKHAFCWYCLESLDVSSARAWRLPAGPGRVCWDARATLASEPGRAPRDLTRTESVRNVYIYMQTRASYVCVMCMLICT